MEFIDYVVENHEQIISLFLEHIELTFIAVGLSILIGVPIGIIISYIKKLDKPILGLSSVIQAVPSMALLGFLIPFVGIGTIPAIIVVILYSLLPLVALLYPLSIYFAIVYTVIIQKPLYFLSSAEAGQMESCQIRGQTTINKGEL